MLFETRRKRRRAGGGAAFTAADLPRPPRRATPPTTVAADAVAAAADVRAAAVRPQVPRIEDANDEADHAAVAETTTPLTPTAPSPPRLVDRRMLLSRASRMQLLLLERLRSVNLRRARRAELLEEITRLKKLMETLQRDIDATTRSLAGLEQLVHNLQQISFDSAVAVAADEGLAATTTPLTTTRLAPGTILWTNPALWRDSDSAELERLAQAAKEDARKARADRATGESSCRAAASRPA